MDEPKEYLVSHWLTSMCHAVALKEKVERRGQRDHMVERIQQRRLFPLSPVNRVENFFCVNYDYFFSIASTYCHAEELLRLAYKKYMRN